MKKCDDDLDTFIANGEYHCDVKSELSMLGPSMAAKARWSMAKHGGACRGTLCTDKILATATPGPSPS